jgi:hypothetical protein
MTVKLILAFSGMFLVVSGFILALLELNLASKRIRPMKHEDSIELQKVKIRIKAYAGIIMIIIGAVLEIIAYVK